MNAKRTRNVTKEYALGEKAAAIHLAPAEPINISAIQHSAFKAGYARALMDVADGKVKPPTPAWSEP